MHASSLLQLSMSIICSGPYNNQVLSIVEFVCIQRDFKTKRFLMCTKQISIVTPRNDVDNSPEVLNISNDTASCAVT